MRRGLGGCTALICLVAVFAGLDPARAAAASTPQILYVNSTADTGATADQCLEVQSGDTGPSNNTTCTLRGAIDEANLNPGSTIEFWICGIFQVTSELPPIGPDTTLDGGAAMYASNNPNAGCTEEFDQNWPDPDPTAYDANPSQNDGCLVAAGDPWYPDCFANYGVAMIEGPGGSQAFPGLVFDGSGSLAVGIFVGGFSDGIVFGPPGNDTFQGGGVGNDPIEQGPLNPPNTGDGIDVQNGSAGDIIGYSVAADGAQGIQGQYDQDDIYGNRGWGVYLAKGSGPTTVGYNFIGTDTNGDQYAQDQPPGGTLLNGNGLGGVYDDGSGDIIGGDIDCHTDSDVCTSNIIAGNQGPGIEFGPDATNDQAASNYVGESLDLYSGSGSGPGGAVDNGPLANADAGVIDQGSDDTIGGASSAYGNQISGNAGPGVELEGSDAIVENNLVGLDFSGSAADANQGAGVLTSPANGVINGGNRILLNTIGGNTGAGVELDQADSSVLSNYIGFAGDQRSPLPNLTGILATAGTQTIGAPTSAPNTIANNSGAGVVVEAPSTAPTDYPVDVTIGDNSIHDNGGLGIDLGGDGVTPNHSPDNQTGPNDWINHPVITSASSANGTWSVHGTLNALPDAYYNIALYGNPSCDPSGYGEGQTLVGGGSLTTDANGNGTWTISSTGSLPPVVTATATNGLAGTSEFSACLDVAGAVSLTTSQSVSGQVSDNVPQTVDVHIANGGPAAATNVELNLSVPSDVSITSEPSGCPAPNGDTLLCDLGTIASGSSLDADVGLEAKSGAQVLTDQVSVSADEINTADSSSSLASSVSGAGQTETFFVNSTADTAATAVDCLDVQAGDIGPAAGTTCTLRGALQEAEQAGAPTTIEFWTCGPFDVSSALPAVPPDTTINGNAALSDPDDPNAGCLDDFDSWYPSTDTGQFSCAQASSAIWEVMCPANADFAHIEGPGNGSFPGLVFDGAGSTMTGVSIGGFSNAVVLGPPGSDILRGNWLGSDPYQDGPLNPPDSGSGVDVLAASANDVIGTATGSGSGAPATSQENFIYGNGGWGIALEKGSGPTVVADDFIGTDSRGDRYATDGPQPADNPPDGAPEPDGNAKGGVYDDGSGDLLGGDLACSTWSGNCTSNVISGNGGPGVELGPDASGDQVAADYIGESLNVYASPVTDGGALANAGPGVLDQGSGDVIGGTTPAYANEISGNTGPGVELAGVDASVANNQIGLSFNGTTADPNQGPGILTTDSGGVYTGNSRILDNTIGGNAGAGVQLDQAGDDLLGNDIGTAGDHSTPLPNAAGVVATRGPETIGGQTSNANVIANNSGAGVAVEDPSSSTYVTGVDIDDNAIFANHGLGIDLGDDGVTANHTPDTQPGPNGWTNYPVLTSASAANGQWAVHGTLSAMPSTQYTIYLWGNQSCDPSGHGQGATLVAGGSVTTDGSGNASFALTGSGALAPVLSATDVGPDGTSEFSACADVGGGVSLTSSQSTSGQVISGEPVEVDVHVANAGPADATNVAVTLTVPDDVAISSQPSGCPAVNGNSFTCDLGTVAAGSSIDTHVLLQPDAGAQTLTDSVQIGADQVDTSGAAGSDLAVAVTPNPSEPSSVTNPIAQASPTYEQFLRLDRVSGTVTAKLPNGQHIDLNNYALVPSGTVVSTTDGVTKVTAAVRSGKTSYADFKYGQFKVTQAKGAGGLVKATLDGSLAGCSAAQLATQTPSAKRTLRDGSGETFLPALARASAAQAAQPTSAKTKTKKLKPKPTKRRLWGHDAGGTYEISGNRGAATVEGTTWAVTDTCTTTTVTVYQDSVKVTGFGDTVPRHATVTAGHRLVLRAR